MTKAEQQVEAYARATANNSEANYGAIYDGFEAKGIDPDDIVPRVNVFTYAAWQHKGRQVRRGEKGVRIVTMIPRKDKKTGKTSGAFRKVVSVFHISQTDVKGPKGPAAYVADDGTLSAEPRADMPDVADVAPMIPDRPDVASKVEPPTFNDNLQF